MGSVTGQPRGSYLPTLGQGNQLGGMVRQAQGPPMGGAGPQINDLVGQVHRNMQGVSAPGPMGSNTYLPGDPRYVPPPGAPPLTPLSPSSPVPYSPIGPTPGPPGGGIGSPQAMVQQALSGTPGQGGTPTIADIIRQIRMLQMGG